MKSYPTPTRFRPAYPHKYVGDVNNIIMRSSWESKLARYLDQNDNILKWGSEIKAIPYYSQVDKRMRRYYPDFWVVLKDRSGVERKVIIEVKPLSQAIPPKTTRRQKTTLLNEAMVYQRNQDKWSAAREYAAKIGFEFVVMTERELGIT
jgi:hypothetical protein